MMLTSLIHKFGQLKSDPVLRRWLMGRLLGRIPAEQAYETHRPPYLDGLLPLVGETPSGDFSQLPDSPPSAPIELSLAGKSVRLEPGEENTLFERTFDDVETTLALHRFAWLPLLGDSVDPAWLVSIWKAWTFNYATPDGGWAWHPYTASERAINVLVFGQRQGLPGPINKTLSILAQHGPAISERLEFFGDHHTSNHLANNGRGLFLLGLTLGLPKCAEMGGRILVEEAKRIFHASGILREGSSHYHALLAVNYGQCADAALEIERPEARALATVAKDARTAAGCLKLPGGFPLIGDISPDLTPEIVLNALSVAENKTADALAEAGWHRFDSGPWSGLWHASPEGFSHMPGHGHQDCGSFELHFNNEPVFIDPGRGSYGEIGEAALYRSAQVHNSLLVDGADPFPPNKPYYDENFRRHIAGSSPRITKDQNSITLAHNGYRRLKNVGEVRRTWNFTAASMTLKDGVDGKGNRQLSRTLITPLEVSNTLEGITLKGRDSTFRLIIDGEASIEKVIRWTAYGCGVPASAIRISSRVSLPWNGAIKVEVL